MKYLYSLTDDEATFMITQQVADMTYTDNIIRLSKTVNDRQVKRPSALVSDGTSILTLLGILYNKQSKDYMFYILDYK